MKTKLPPELEDHLLELDLEDHFARSNKDPHGLREGAVKPLATRDRAARPRMPLLVAAASMLVVMLVVLESRRTIAPAQDPLADASLEQLLASLQVACSAL